MVYEKCVLWDWHTVEVIAGFYRTTLVRCQLTRDVNAFLFLARLIVWVKVLVPMQITIDNRKAEDLARNAS
jgi:hypothetical protein